MKIKKETNKELKIEVQKEKLDKFCPIEKIKAKWQKPTPRSH